MRFTANESSKKHVIPLHLSSKSQKHVTDTTVSIRRI